MGTIGVPLFLQLPSALEEVLRPPLLVLPDALHELGALGVARAHVREAPQAPWVQLGAEAAPQGDPNMP